MIEFGSNIKLGSLPKSIFIFLPAHSEGSKDEEGCDGWGQDEGNLHDGVVPREKDCEDVHVASHEYQEVEELSLA